MEFTDERTERYRQAEQAVWRHYGLEPSEQFIEIESLAARLRIQEVGSGEPIVFVHGGLWPAVALAPLVRELAGYRCILIDRPGCGLSSPVDWRKQNIRSVATRVMGGVVDALGLERTHVIGHSIGGAWALRLAQGHPSRVARVAILGASPLLADLPRPGFLRVLASPIGAILTRLPQNQDRARSILRQDGHGPSLDAGRIPDMFFDWHVALMRDTQTMRNERAMIRDAVIGGGGWRPGLTFEPTELSAIRQPLLYIIGTADPEGSVAYAERVVAMLPDAKLNVLRDGGHLLWLDDPVHVGNTIRSFLDDSHPVEPSPSRQAAGTPRP
jgi:pimeloyl-ACP methyl ester carboxylesterase